MQIRTCTILTFPVFSYFFAVPIREQQHPTAPQLSVGMDCLALFELGGFRLHVRANRKGSKRAARMMARGL